MSLILIAATTAASISSPFKVLDSESKVHLVASGFGIGEYAKLEVRDSNGVWTVLHDDELDPLNWGTNSLLLEGQMVMRVNKPLTAGAVEIKLVGEVTDYSLLT